MKKVFVTMLVVLLLLGLSMPGFAAAKRFVLLDPCHGGLNYGFELNGKLEKDLNLTTAFNISQYLSHYTMTRDSDKDNNDGKYKSDKVTGINPNLILGIHHHGKYSAFIEYNNAGRRVAYQLAAYFAGQDIPHKLVNINNPDIWLFGQPCPSLVLIVNDEVEAKMNVKIIAKILEGLD